MSLWLQIQQADGDESATAPMRPSLGKLFGKLSRGDQKGELAMLVILAGAAVVVVTAAFLQSGSFVEQWAEFVESVRGFLRDII